MAVRCILRVGQRETKLQRRRDTKEQLGWAKELISAQPSSSIARNPTVLSSSVLFRSPVVTAFCLLSLIWKMPSQHPQHPGQWSAGAAGWAGCSLHPRMCARTPLRWRSDLIPSSSAWAGLWLSAECTSPPDSFRGRPHGSFPSCQLLDFLLLKTTGDQKTHVFSPD